jgi:hypothetical protein
MEGGVGILLIIVAGAAIAFVLAWLLGWGGFAGVMRGERAAERAEERGRPEHTRPTSPAQEHTEFVGTDRRE